MKPNYALIDLEFDIFHVFMDCVHNYNNYNKNLKKDWLNEIRSVKRRIEFIKIREEEIEFYKLLNEAIKNLESGIVLWEKVETEEMHNFLDKYCRLNEKIKKFKRENYQYNN